MRSSQTKTVRKTRKNRKTRKQWAAVIRADHKRFVDDFFKTGDDLIAAKRDLVDHGEFLAMIEHDLPFGAKNAQRMMRVARDPKLRKGARVHLLPMALGTCDELRKLTDEAFERALDRGEINPEMTRNQAISMVTSYRTISLEPPPGGVNVSHYTKSIESVGYVSEPTTIDLLPHYKSDEPTEPTDANDGHDDEPLSQCERSAADLVMAIQRGDMKPDAIVKERVRALIRLLAAIADDEHSTLTH
jgi:hypothetical protein